MPTTKTGPRRPVGRAQLESIAASVTPEEVAKAKRRYESHGWTRPDSGIGVRASGWTNVQVPTAILDDLRMTTRQRKGRTVRERMIGKCGRLVLLALCRFVNAKGICWPSWATIQAVSCLHPRDVLRGIQELEEAGYLERDKGIWNPGRKGRATVYCLRAAARKRRFP